ncbi:MAG: hypothetical protein M3328_11560 [Chloroflexota bacterium]|nr:hypothetical protein [Chloroflexota bacterium]
MSTGHMPNPPDQPTSQAQDADVKGQNTPTTQAQTVGDTTTPVAPAQEQTQTQAPAQASAPAAPEPSAAPASASAVAEASATTEAQPETQIESVVPLNEEIARIIEDRLGTIAQQMVYHCQTMFGVGGIGTDPVTARDGAYYVAQSLREQSLAPGVHALVNLGDPQVAQVNDRTFPFKFNAQAAGLLEGILVDTVSKAYSDNPARRKEATRLLNSIFLAANDQLQRELKVIPMMGQAPATGRDYYALTEGAPRDLSQAGTQGQQAAETQG